MFKSKTHGFFCRCEACKIKRKTSIFYMGLLVSSLIILIYQAFLTMFFTTKLNAVILFCELLFVICGFFRILF